MVEVSLKTLHDSATPAVQRLLEAMRPSKLRNAMGRDCTRLVQEHLRANGPNKRGWPSTGFYNAAAKNTSWNGTSTGFEISTDHPDKPGSMRQRYYGGTIRKKDKLLTIPARAEFYGRKATDFDNLRFGMFKSGTKFLYINIGGTGLVDFATGLSRSASVRGQRGGTGARSAMMVAYWLVDEVTQKADQSVIPSPDRIAATAVVSAMDEVRKAIANG